MRGWLVGHAEAVLLQTTCVGVASGSRSSSARRLGGAGVGSFVGGWPPSNVKHIVLRRCAAYNPEPAHCLFHLLSLCCLFSTLANPVPACRCAAYNPDPALSFVGQSDVGSKVPGAQGCGAMAGCQVCMPRQRWQPAEAPGAAFRRVFGSFAVWRAWMPSAPAQCHRPIAAIAPPCHIPLRVPSSNRSPLRPQSNTRKYAIYCRALQAPSSSRLSPPSKRRSKRSVPLAGRAAPPPSAAPVARAAAKSTSTCTAPPPARSSQVSAGGQRPGTGVLGGANALTEPFSAWAQPRRVCWGRGTFGTHVAGLAVLQALHSPVVPQAALTGPLCAGRTPMV